MVLDDRARLAAAAPHKACCARRWDSESPGPVPSISCIRRHLPAMAPRRHTRSAAQQAERAWRERRPILLKNILGFGNSTNTEMVLLGRRDGQTWSFATSRGAYDRVTAADVQRQYWPENLPKPGDMDDSSKPSTPTWSRPYTPPTVASCSRSQSTLASSCSRSPRTSTSSRSHRPPMSSRYRPYTPTSSRALSPYTFSSRSHSPVEDIFPPHTIDGAPGGASILRAPRLPISSSEPSAISGRACGRNEELEDMARLLEALAGH